MLPRGSVAHPRHELVDASLLLGFVSIPLLVLLDALSDAFLGGLQFGDVFFSQEPTLEPRHELLHHRAYSFLPAGTRSLERERVRNASRMLDVAAVFAFTAATKVATVEVCWFTAIVASR